MEYHTILEVACLITDGDLEVEIEVRSSCYTSLAVEVLFAQPWWKGLFHFHHIQQTLFISITSSNSLSGGQDIMAFVSAEVFMHIDKA